MNLLWAAMAVISSPGAGTPLKVAPQGRDTFSQHWIFGWVPFELSLNSTWTVCQVSLPWSRDNPQSLRFLTERSFLVQGGEIFTHDRSSITCWYQAESIIIMQHCQPMYSILIIINFVWIIPLDINHCPNLRLRLDLNAPWLHQEFRKQRGTLWTSWLTGRVSFTHLCLTSLCKSF